MGLYITETKISKTPSSTKFCEKGKERKQLLTGIRYMWATVQSHNSVTNTKMFPTSEKKRHKKCEVRKRGWNFFMSSLEKEHKEKNSDQPHMQSNGVQIPIKAGPMQGRSNAPGEARGQAAGQNSEQRIVTGPLLVKRQWGPPIRCPSWSL